MPQCRTKPLISGRVQQQAIARSSLNAVLDEALAVVAVLPSQMDSAEWPTHYIRGTPATLLHGCKITSRPYLSSPSGSGRDLVTSDS
jgi:hypothetical protein